MKTTDKAVVETGEKTMPVRDMDTFFAQNTTSTALPSSSMSSSSSASSSSSVSSADPYADNDERLRAVFKKAKENFEKAKEKYPALAEYSNFRDAIVWFLASNRTALLEYFPKEILSPVANEMVMELFRDNGPGVDILYFLHDGDCNQVAKALGLLVLEESKQVVDRYFRRRYVSLTKEKLELVHGSYHTLSLQGLNGRESCECCEEFVEFFVKNVQDDETSQEMKKLTARSVYHESFRKTGSFYTRVVLGLMQSTLPDEMLRNIAANFPQETAGHFLWAASITGGKATDEERKRQEIIKTSLGKAMTPELAHG
jgi:hypothetical protein